MYSRFSIRSEASASDLQETIETVECSLAANSRVWKITIICHQYFE